MTKTYFYIFLAIILSLWSILCHIQIASNENLQKTTKNILALSKKNINQFKQQHQRFPQDMGELRAYMRTIDADYVPYDAWGSRLKYLPISQEWFYIKSFGADLMENQIASKTDLNLNNIAPLPASPPSRLNSDQSALHLYPGVVLASFRSPTNALVAEVVIDPLAYTKRILIRDLSDRDFILSSFHDKVQEFFWLPDGERILFTASGSYRYEDGIYIWDLTNNRIVNIVNLFKTNFEALNFEKLYMTLSSIDVDSHRIFMFLKPMSDLMLAPREFYSTKNLYSFIWNSETSLPESLEDYTDVEATVFSKPVVPRGTIEGSFVGMSSQQEWMKLPDHGSIQEVIEAWQEFCNNNSESPLFPYGLWWLSSIYGYSVVELLEESPEEAIVLRNYGIEIAQALDDMITAPDYMRAMALHIKYSLQNEIPLDYQLVTVEP